MGLIDKNKLEQFYESGTDPLDTYADMVYIRAEHIDDVPEVDAAKIQKLCNDIEDVACDIARITMNDVIYAESRMIFDKAKDIAAEISKQLTIEPEQRHGQWIMLEPYGTHHTHCRKCSECGEIKAKELTNFCPNCGADMREVNEDAN